MLRTFLVAFALLACVAAYGQTKGLAINDDQPKRVLDTTRADYDKRYALVIGNNDYTNGRLKNPVNDATDVAALLEKYGFKVTLKTNVSKNDMRSVIETFGSNVRKKKGIALFYFSGHGLQQNDQNYLLPLHANLANANDVPAQTICLDSVLAQITYSTRGLSIVLLDACRTSPYRDLAPRAGLTKNTGETRNTLVFYATGPNTVAEDGIGHNSPFTEALLHVIGTADSIEIAQIATDVTRMVEDATHEQQSPQLVCSKSRYFYFKKRTTGRKPTLYVLSIGIDRYADPAHRSLQYGAKGAMDFVAAFKDQAPGVYDKVESYCLTDSVATFINIYSKISAIRNKADPGDVILLYFNGYMLNSLGEAYLVAHDGQADAPFIGGINTALVASLLAMLPCKTLLFLDAVVSAELAETDSMRLPGIILANELRRPRNNVSVILASSGRESTHNDAHDRGSVFSQVWLQGMANAGSTDNPGYIDVGSLGRYLEQKVPQETHGEQHPRLLRPDGWDNFILAKKAPRVPEPVYDLVPQDIKR